MAQVTLCDWNECMNTADFGVGLAEETGGIAEGWGGHSFDACEIHIDRPIGAWIAQWMENAEEWEKEEKALLKKKGA